MTTWDSEPFVVIEKILCPWCAATSGRLVVRSELSADGSTTRRCICKGCSRRYVVILELPQSSRAEVDNAYHPGNGGQANV
jgi:hypothetical protein